MCKRHSRRDFLKASTLFGMSLGSSTVLTPRLALADEPGDFRVCINLELLGGMDNFTCWLPTDANRFSALMSVRPGAMFASNPNDTIPFHNIGLHPNLAPLVANHASKLKFVLNTSNALNTGQTTSHELAQNVMTTGTRQSSGKLKGWKANLFDADDSTALVGFAGSKGANFNCDVQNARCRNTPPIRTSTFETFTFEGVNFSHRLGGAANTSHVAEAIERLAQIEAPSRDIVGLELQARNSIRGTFPAISRIAEILSYETPLAAQYPGGILANRLRNIASKVMQMKATGSSERVVIALGLGGFDTHSNWLSANNNLASNLGNSLAAFFSDLDAIGASQNVLLFTSTDFGRINFWNGSGTDHGGSSTTIVLGGAVRPGVYGDPPSAHNLGNERVPPSVYDNRALISQVLTDFMGIEHTKAFPGRLADEFDLHDFDLLKQLV